MSPLDSHFVSRAEVVCDDILPLLKWHGHAGDIGLFRILRGIFCHNCYICHCHIIFILCGSMDDKIFGQPSLLFLWYVAELYMEHKSLVKTASCVTAGGVSVLLDICQAARSVKAPQTSTEQR